MRPEEEKELERNLDLQGYQIQINNGERKLKTTVNKKTHRIRFENEDEHKVVVVIEPK
jgi:hypothetical protein